MQRIHLDLEHERQIFVYNDKNPNFVPNDDHNRFFIAGTQHLLNDRLAARGYVFLNEVLDALGIARTKAGQLVGWQKGNGDFVEIKIEQTMISDGRPREYFLRIEHGGFILDVLGD